PSSSLRLTPSTALSPPKRFERSSARKIMAAGQAEEEPRQAEGLEENDHHEQDAVQAEIELRIRSDEVLPHQHEYHRAERGAGDGADAADDAHQDPGDGAIEAEHVAGLDVAEVGSVE